MHLIPLIKCKLLKKEPATNSLQLEDRLSVNLEYKSNLIRNKIGVLVSKHIKETNNEKVQSKVEDDRRFTIDASIMKVMKSRRKIDYQQLIIETTKLLQARFKPDPMQIK